MSVAALIVAVATVLLGSSPWTIGAGTVSALTLVDPIVGIGSAGLMAGVIQVRRIGSMRGTTRSKGEEGTLAVEMIALGVTAGLPFRSAAGMTAGRVSERIDEDIRGALRRLDAGRPPTLRSPALRAAFDIAVAAEGTGMPLAASLIASAAERRRESAVLARERIARLPVKMLFPLAFLILPGFVLVIVVPPLVAGLSRLGF